VDEKTKLKDEFYRRAPITDAEQRDAVWALLNSEGYVDVALTEAPESPLQVLLKDADLIIKGAEMGSRSATPPPSMGEPEEQEAQEQREEIRPVLDDLERERAAAFEEHVARIAANDFHVRRYRERVLGGKLLNPEQARALFHSPAAQVFSSKQFSNWAIPLVDHTAELKGTEETVKGNRVVGGRFTVYVEPPGMERAISRRLRELPFVNESGYAESISVGEDSVLGDLAELADKLHATYPWESKPDIVHFVLTGAVPAVPPVRMHYSRKRKPDSELSPGGFSHGTITLEIVPWISAKSVEAAFRDAKRQVSRNRKYRRLEEKSLKMIRFVAQYDEPPKGRRLLEAWNAQELVKKRIENDPTWYYDPDKRGESSRFWRDYHRARHALVYDKRSRPDDDLRQF
jgi:hypothetical protein